MSDDTYLITNCKVLLNIFTSKIKNTTTYYTTQYFEILAFSTRRLPLSTDRELTPGRTDHTLAQILARVLKLPNPAFCRSCIE